MSTEEFEISQSMAAELTDSVGLQDDGSGDMSDSLAADLHDQETMLAERDIPVSNDVEDTAQGELDREAEQEQTQQRGKKVPLQALHAERQKRQALELQVQAQAQQLQQFIAQQQQAQQAQQQAAEQAAIPDFDEDPRGYIEAKERQFAQALAQVQNGGQQPQHQQQAQQLEAQVMQEAAVLAPVLADAEARFEAEHPDYQQAFDHVQRIVDAQLRSRYPSATPEQLQLAHRAELVGHVKNCQARGIDPCQAVYASAQGLGYKPAAPTPRREAPTSLSNLGGAPRAPDEKGSVGVGDISSMSAAEFDDFWNSMKRGSAVGPAF